MSNAIDPRASSGLPDNRLVSLDVLRGITIAMLVVALLGYWVLLRWVQVPGFGMPGRDIPLFDPTRNLGAYIDRHSFPGRLYRGVRDPEGLLSTIPALGTTLLGMLTGMWLRSERSSAMKVSIMLAGALLEFFWACCGDAGSRSTKISGPVPMFCLRLASLWSRSRFAIG